MRPSPGSSRQLAALLISAAASSACASGASVAVADGANPPWLLASLQRTECEGWCPVYRVEIWSDGRVEWDGRRYVLVQERRSARLDPLRLSRVRAAFLRARYFDLEGDFACKGQGRSDEPWVVTSFDDGTRSRTIEHNTGCWAPLGQDALDRLERDLDAIVNMQRWAGTVEER